MASKTVEVGNCGGRSSGLGFGASWAAASKSEDTFPHLALQARKLATRFRLTPASARAVAALAFEVRGRQ